MIPPVRTDLVWSRAQSGPVPPEGRTGPSPRLAVLDWTGLVWTSPNRILFINFKVDLKNYRSETVIPATLTQTQPKGRSAAKAQWEGDKCIKHFGYRLKGKAGNRRPIQMRSAKSLATRFYQLKCGHAPTRALNTGASPPSLQPVKIPSAGALEEGGKGNGLESWPMLAGTGVGAVIYGDI